MSHRGSAIRAAEVGQKPNAPSSPGPRFYKGAGGGGGGGGGGGNSTASVACGAPSNGFSRSSRISSSSGDGSGNGRRGGAGGKDSDPSMPQSGSPSNGYNHSCSRIGSPEPRGGLGAAGRQARFVSDGGSGAVDTTARSSAKAPGAAPRGAILMGGRDRVGGLSREQELEIANEMERELRGESNPRRSSSSQNQRSEIDGRGGGGGGRGHGGAGESRLQASPQSEPRGSVSSADRGQGKAMFGSVANGESDGACGMSSQSFQRQQQQQQQQQQHQRQQRRILSQPPPSHVAGNSSRRIPAAHGKPPRSHPPSVSHSRQQFQQPGVRPGEAHGTIMADGGDANAGEDASRRRRAPSPCAYPTYVKGKRNDAAPVGAYAFGSSMGAEGGRRQATAVAVTVFPPSAPSAARRRGGGPAAVGGGAEGQRFKVAAMGTAAASGGAREDALDVLGEGGMGSHRVVQAAVPLGTKKVQLQILDDLALFFVDMRSTLLVRAAAAGPIAEELCLKTETFEEAAPSGMGVSGLRAVVVCAPQFLKPGGVMEEAGMVDGDLITYINGEGVSKNSPEAFVWNAKSVKGVRLLDIAFLRATGESSARGFPWHEALAWWQSGVRRHMLETHESAASGGIEWMRAQDELRGRKAICSYRLYREFTTQMRIAQDRPNSATLGDERSNSSSTSTGISQDRAAAKAPSNGTRTTGGGGSGSPQRGVSSSSTNGAEQNDADNAGNFHSSRNGGGEAQETANRAAGGRTFEPNGSTSQQQQGWQHTPRAAAAAAAAPATDLGSAGWQGRALQQQQQGPGGEFTGMSPSSGGGGLGDGGEAGRDRSERAAAVAEAAAEGVVQVVGGIAALVAAASTSVPAPAAAMIKGDGEGEGGGGEGEGGGGEGEGGGGGETPAKRKAPDGDRWGGDGGAGEAGPASKRVGVGVERRQGERRAPPAVGSAGGGESDAQNFEIKTADGGSGGGSASLISGVREWGEGHVLSTSGDRARERTGLKGGDNSSESPAADTARPCQTERNGNSSGVAGGGSGGGGGGGDGGGSGVCEDTSSSGTKARTDLATNPSYGDALDAASSSKRPKLNDASGKNVSDGGDSGGTGEGQAGGDAVRSGGGGGGDGGEQGSSPKITGPVPATCSSAVRAGGSREGTDTNRPSPVFVRSSSLPVLFPAMLAPGTSNASLMVNGTGGGGGGGGSQRYFQPYQPQQLQMHQMQMRRNQQMQMPQHAMAGGVGNGVGVGVGVGVGARGPWVPGNGIGMGIGLPGGGAGGMVSQPPPQARFRPPAPGVVTAYGGGVMMSRPGQGGDVWVQRPVCGPGNGNGPWQQPRVVMGQGPGLVPPLQGGSVQAQVGPVASGPAGAWQAPAPVTATPSAATTTSLGNSPGISKTNNGSYNENSNTTATTTSTTTATTTSTTTATTNNPDLSASEILAGQQSTKTEENRLAVDRGGSSPPTRHLQNPTSGGEGDGAGGGEDRGYGSSPGGAGGDALDGEYVRGSDGGSDGGERRQSCDYCSMKKTKCSGTDPCHRCVRDQVVCVYSSRKRAGRRLALTAATKAADPFSVAAVTVEGNGGGGGGVTGGVAVGGEVNSASISPAGFVGPPGWRVPVTTAGYWGGGGAVGRFFPQPHFVPGNGNGWAVAVSPSAAMMDPSGVSGSSGGSGGCGPGAFRGPRPAYGGSGPGGVGVGMLVGSSTFSGAAGAGVAKMLHQGIAAAFRAAHQKGEINGSNNGNSNNGNAAVSVARNGTSLNFPGGSGGGGGGGSISGVGVGPGIDPWDPASTRASTQI
eukprot:g10405.t1